MFHADASNGASLLCLATSVTETVIEARNIATQIVYQFDRRTGTAEWPFGSEIYRCTIDSVAPLPLDIREILLALDDKYRRAIERGLKEPDYEPAPDEFHLTKDQKRALLFVGPFYRAHPI